MIPGVLLTGGTSRRMGADKATLVVRGEPMAARVARVLTEVCDPVVEVGPGVTGLPSVREEPSGSGPLIAFLAGVDALHVDGPVLLVGCDLPFVDAELLRTLIDWPGPHSVFPIVGERAQYVCARWSADAVAAGRVARAEGECGLRALAAAPADTLPVSAVSERAVDVDTPDDLRRLGLS